MSRAMEVMVDDEWSYSIENGRESNDTDRASASESTHTTRCLGGLRWSCSAGIELDQ